MNPLNQNVKTNRNFVNLLSAGKARPKFAVVGTGAAALGVLTALLSEKSDFEITVYDIGKHIVEEPSLDNPSEEWITAFYDEVYRKIRSLNPFKFPPPKTHFGNQIARQDVGKHLRIFKSESFGGLTNYWGATMLPFTGREMANWPISNEALYPYYQKIAELVGLAARPDALNEYFLQDFSTRPPIRPTTMLDHLDRVVNHHRNSGQFKVVSGLNRCAIETRDDHPNSCVYCGECMTGCFRGSVYSTRSTIEQYLKDPRVTRVVKGRVMRIDEKNRAIDVQTDNALLQETGFSKVFLSAGCISSTEIVMRSVGLRSGPVVKDNAVYVFPILYLGRTPPEARCESYMSECNLIFGCIPKDTDEYFAQVQVYPNFDYLWRYNIPPRLWPIIRPCLWTMRSRFFWGRLYIHSDYSQGYSIELKDDQLVMEEVKPDDVSGYVKALMHSIRAAVNQQGFYIPPIPPLRQKVNSHYVGTLPFGGDLLDVPPNGEVMPGVYLCDPACFPESPAVNLGFTIIANASRIASEALN